MHIDWTRNETLVALIILAFCIVVSRYAQVARS